MRTRLPVIPLALSLALTPALASAQDQGPFRPVAAVRPVVEAPPAEPATRLRSSQLLAGGICSMVLGLVGVVAGVALVAGARPERDNGLGHELDVTFGRGYAVTGGTLLVAGATMAIIGGTRVPVRPGGAVPAVAAGPGGVSLRWSF